MKTAMILAAGRGERLRPFTELYPKALCSINNLPLIEHHVINLARAGFQRIVINHAYLGGKIRKCLGNGERFGVEICYTPEPPGGLETGGGIFNALPLLGNVPFVTVNADIYTDFDFNSINLTPSALAHIILVKIPSYRAQGDFGLTMHNQINSEKLYVFTGIACYHPQLFDDLKPGRYSMGNVLRQLVSTQQVTGEIYSGAWLDIGSPERLKEAQQIFR